MKTKTQAPEVINPSAAVQTKAKRRYKEVWLVEDHPNRKAWWTRVGVAFENKDGSWNLHLSAVPVGRNTLQVRDPRPNSEASDIDSGAVVAA